MQIDKNAIVHENVILGKNCIIEANVEIGKLSRKKTNKKTIIGDNAIIRNGTIIYEGVIIGDNFESGEHAIIRENVEIKDNFLIGNHCLVLPYTKIGNKVLIHSLCEIAEYTQINDYAWLGPGVIILNTKHPKAINFSNKERSDKEGAPIIGEYVRIGGNATILPFVKIGNRSIIGAGAVVTKSVESNKVVVGNPAKVIKDIDELRDVYDKDIKSYS